MAAKVRFFYNAHVRHAIGVFGSLFSNFYVAKFGQNTEEISELHLVPIMYRLASHQTMTARVQDDVYRSFLETYPRMTFEWNDISMDSTRKTAPVSRIRNSNDPSQVSYTPVPINLDMELNVISREMSSGLQLIEQIIQYFRPTIAVTSKNGPWKDFEEDIFITLNGVSMEDSAEDLNSTRMVVFRLSFTVGINFWGASSNSVVNLKRHLENGTQVITTIEPSGPDGLQDVDPAAAINRIVLDWHDIGAFPAFTPTIFREETEINPLDATGPEGLDPEDPYITTTTNNPTSTIP